ncbi:major facilitator superfamily domain-containing protein [Schizophyllum commune]
MSLDRGVALDVPTKDAFELTARVSSRRSVATGRFDGQRTSCSTLADQTAVISPHSNQGNANQDDANPEDAMVNVSQLPPVDGGFGAWSFLAAAFMVETIAWAFSTAYGTLLYAYMEDPTFGSQPHATSLLALIGPIGSGIMYCLCPALNPLLTRYPRAARPIVWAGTLICFVSLFASSYARTVIQLVALQGVLYSIGGTMVYVPTIFYMSQWFVERRGVANGVMMAGTSLGGVLLPLVLPPLLARVGLGGTLRIFAGVTTAALVPFLPFIRGRVPETVGRGRGARARDVREAGRGDVRESDARDTASTRGDGREAGRSGEGSRAGGADSTTAAKRWWTEPSFLLLLAVNTLQAFGYFAPMLWLPTFASELNLSPFKSSVSLSVLNAGAALGRISTGFLSDRFNPWAVAFLTLLTTALSAFVLWGVLAYTYAGLLAFSVVYGAFSGGWAALWTGLMPAGARDDPNLATTLFGWLLLTRGVGNIVSTPISTALETPVYCSGSTNGSIAATSLSNGKLSPFPSSNRPPSSNQPPGLANLTTAATCAGKTALDLGFDVAGGRFEKMIIYTGACFAGAALMVTAGWGVEARRRRAGEGRG